MSLESKTLKLCTCNGTMALDREAPRRGAEDEAADHGAHASSAARRRARSRPSLADPDLHRRLHAGSAAVRRARVGGAIAGAHLPSSTSARRPAGRPKARTRDPRSRRCSRRPRCRSPSRCRRWLTSRAASCSSSGRPARRSTGRSASRARCEVSVLLTGGAAGEQPAERSYPVWSGKVERHLRLARRLRGRVGAGQSDRPRPLHALQRLRARLPGGRDRLQLPDRPRQVQGAPRLRQGLRRR